MDKIFYIILGLAAAYALYRLLKPKKVGDDFSGNPLDPEQIKRRSESLKRIELLVKTKGRVTTQDVQRFMGVSEATANRYLDYLVSLNRLIRVGERGQQVGYKLPN